MVDMLFERSHKIYMHKPSKIFWSTNIINKAMEQK